MVVVQQNPSLGYFVAFIVVLCGLVLYNLPELFEFLKKDKQNLDI